MSNNTIFGIKLVFDNAAAVGDITASDDQLKRLGVTGGNAGKAIGDGAQKGREGLDAVAGAVEALTTKMATMGHAGAALFAVNIAAGYAQSVVDAADSYTKLTASLHVATKSAQEYATASADVKRISTVAQSDIQATAQLYGKLNMAMDGTGVSQAQVARITETVSLGLKVNGASAAETSSAMLQLSQAFGSGVLRGEEFNAMAEAAPNLLRQLAASMGITYAQLRGMAEQGLITSDVLAKAFGDERALAGLREQAASMQTVSGAAVVLANNAMMVTGELMKQSGATHLASSAIGGLSSTLAGATPYLGQVASGIVGITAGAAAFGALKGSVAVYEYMAAQAALRIELQAVAVANANKVMGDMMAGSAAKAAAAATLQQAAAAGTLAGSLGAARVAMLAFIAANPFLLVATAVAVGVSAWISYGDAAEVAGNKALEAAGRAGKAAGLTGIAAMETNKAAALALFQRAQLGGDKDLMEKARDQYLKLHEDIRIAKKEADEKELGDAATISDKWVKAHGSDASQRALKVADLRKDYAAMAAVIADGSGSVAAKKAAELKLTQDFNAALAEINKPAKKMGSTTTQADPLNSGFESLQADNMRAKMAAQGTTATEVSGELKLYELAIKGVTAAHKLEADGKPVEAAAMRDHTAAVILAARTLVDETTAASALVVEQKALTKAREQADAFVKKMNQSAAQTADEQAFQIDVLGKTASQVARLTAERKAQLAVEQEVARFEAMRKDSPAAADAGIAQVRAAAPALVANAGAMAQQGAQQAAVANLDGVNGGAEQRRYANELDAQNAYFEAGKSDKEAHDRAMEGIEARHQVNLVELMRKGHASAAQLDQISAMTKTKLLLGNLGSILGALGGYNKQAFELNKAYSKGKAVVDTASAVMEHAKLPFPLNVGQVAADLVLGASQLATINSASFGGGAASSGGYAAASSGAMPQLPAVPSLSSPNSVTGSGAAGAATPVTISIAINALDPNSLNAATLQRIADSLTPAIQSNFARNGQQVVVMM